MPKRAEQPQNHGRVSHFSYLHWFKAINSHDHKGQHLPPRNYDPQTSSYAFRLLPNANSLSWICLFFLCLCSRWSKDWPWRWARFGCSSRRLFKRPTVRVRMLGRPATAGKLELAATCSAQKASREMSMLQRSWFLHVQGCNSCSPAIHLAGFGFWNLPPNHTHFGFQEKPAGE